LVYHQYISAKIHSKCASQIIIAKKSLKTHIFGVQRRSRSSMLVPPESSSAVLVMIRSKSVSICNHSPARLVDSSRNRTFSRGYPHLMMRSYGGLLEPRGSNLTPLKSTFNAEHFIRRLSWSILNVFGAISLLICVLQPKIANNSLKPLFWGFKVVQGHRCWYPRKARQQCLLTYAASLCLSATVFTLDKPI